MIHANIVKILTGSVNKKITDIRAGIRLFFEGQDLDMAGLNEWAELRLTGPRIYQLNGCNRYEIDLNIMCSAKATTNIYRSQEMAQSFIAEVIPVYKAANEQIGCLTLRRDVERQLDIVQWGRVEVQQTQVIQTSLEAFYEMELDR